MRQSNNKKSRHVTAFLYERLSRDDNLEGESYSIGNQKKLLTKVAKEKGYTNLVHFLDDGISGVTMDRPGFVEMIRQLEQGRAAAVFVKDLSRLGRNYIEVGRLTEEFFPEHDIRLVAVSDNIDTAEGENELAPIRTCSMSGTPVTSARNGVSATRSRVTRASRWASPPTVTSKTPTIRNAGLWMTRRPR
ncbi:MAG: recombinase family protein [Candidatus Fimivicinus sp.]|nr:recombinase family protein [Oscillospiraceae bacterium]MDY5590194.1 recombinase family protein [Candidatus Fimivicinus sp.]